MRLFVQIAFLSLICVCGGCVSSYPSEKVRIASEVRSKTFKKLEKEMGLIPFGSGGQMMNQIEMLGLSFQYRHPIGIEEGRKMLMEAANEFLREINSNEKIRPYLDIYPFEPKNVEILIFPQKSDGSNVDIGELAVIAIRNGIFQYKSHVPNTVEYDVYEETYEEACKILEEKSKAV